jgi:hypothetical protein
MINVEITPFGRTLMSAYIGAMAYQANVQRRNMEMIKRDQAVVSKFKQEADMWEEMSFDITSGMIDKRYNDSKKFIASGGQSGAIRFKRSLTEQERHIQYLTTQNMLKARTRYENTVSNYNQKMVNHKLRASIKKIDLRPFF